jgi:molecular chaperone GrpE
MLDDEPQQAPETAADSQDTLRAEVEAKAREAAEAHDRYLRALADFDNFRRRVAREREEWRRQAQEELVREILPILDNFDRALAAEPSRGADGGFRAGVELIHRDFLNALERIGVRPFGARGESFDPQRHEAVGRVERADVADHTVVDEMQRGYLFHDRVLRPAQVVVAVEPLPPDSGEAAS